MNAYLISHLGLGDALYMIGAVRYLLQYYKNIYFICKDIYENNIKLFFKNYNNIIIITINSNNEFNSIKKLVHKINNENDILICGFHKKYIKSRISNKKLLSRIKDKNRYVIDYDTLNSSNYKFIENFYNDINLDLNIFFEYFKLPNSIESITNYYKLLNYDNIIFIHTKASNKKLNINNLYSKNIMKDNTIMVCSDHNIYESTQDLNEHQLQKFNLCNDLINIPIIYYIEIIKKCNEIYIIDSCFTGIVLPLLKTNKLNAKIIRIIERNNLINL